MRYWILHYKEHINRLQLVFQRLKNTKPKIQINETEFLNKKLNIKNKWQQTVLARTPIKCQSLTIFQYPRLKKKFIILRFIGVFVKITNNIKKCKNHRFEITLNVLLINIVKCKCNKNLINWYVYWQLS